MEIVGAYLAKTKKSHLKIQAHEQKIDKHWNFVRQAILRNLSYPIFSSELVSPCLIKYGRGKTHMDLKIGLCMYPIFGAHERQNSVYRKNAIEFNESYYIKLVRIGHVQLCNN